MGGHLTKPSNKNMVDRLVEKEGPIRSEVVEGAFRAVDRAMYFEIEEGERVDPYEDQPWRRGNLHISAPLIYGRVLQTLDLKPGQSFLNLGSGTGYLSTLVGLLIGPNGTNHGIEIHADVVAHAKDRLQMFKQKSNAIDKYDFVEPIFITGNCINLNPNSRYDRIYLGAGCRPEMELFIKRLLKPNGILVMPVDTNLMKYTRLGENEWSSEKLENVVFHTMMGRDDVEMNHNNNIASNDCDSKLMIDMPMRQVMSLKELCRIRVRQHLRQKADLNYPNLLHSDNFAQRRKRRQRAQQAMMEREKALIERRRLQEEEARARRATRAASSCRYCSDCVRQGKSTLSKSNLLGQPSTVVGEENSAASQDRIVTRSVSRLIQDSAGKSVISGQTNARSVGSSGSSSTNPSGPNKRGETSHDFRAGSDSNRTVVSKADQRQDHPSGPSGCSSGRPVRSRRPGGPIRLSMRDANVSVSPSIVGPVRRRCVRGGHERNPQLIDRSQPPLSPSNLYLSDDSLDWSDYDGLEPRGLAGNQLEGFQWSSAYMIINMLDNRPAGSSRGPSQPGLHEHGQSPSESEDSDGSWESGSDVDVDVDGANLDDFAYNVVSGDDERHDLNDGDHDNNELEGDDNNPMEFTSSEHNSSSSSSSSSPSSSSSDEEDDDSIRSSDSYSESNPNDNEQNDNYLGASDSSASPSMKTTRATSDRSEGPTRRRPSTRRSPGSRQLSLQQPGSSLLAAPPAPQLSASSPNIARDGKRKRHSSSSDSSSSDVVRSSGARTPTNSAECRFGQTVGKPAARGPVRAPDGESELADDRQQHDHTYQQQHPLPARRDRHHHQHNHHHRHRHRHHHHHHHHHRHRCGRRHRQPRCCHHQDRYSSPGGRLCCRAHWQGQPNRSCQPHNHSSGYLCRNHRQQYQHEQLARQAQHQHQQQQPQPQPERDSQSPEPSSRRLGEIEAAPRRAGRYNPEPSWWHRASVREASAELRPALAASGGGPSLAFRMATRRRKWSSLVLGSAHCGRKRRRRANLDEVRASADSHSPGGLVGERKRKRRQNECEKYRNHMSRYISQLPLPRVLLAYLNYDRAFSCVAGPKEEAEAEEGEQDEQKEGR